jgi:hypothetical protein
MSKYTVIGFVEKINEKNGNSPRGPWTAYSVKIQDATTGDVNPLWFQFGFEKPGFAEGDYIEFEAEPKNDKAAQFVAGSGKKPKNPPAKPAAPAKTGGGGGGFKAAKVTKSELFGDIGGYNTEDDIKRITLACSRTAAVDVIIALLEHDALPMSGAKSKAGQSKRYAEVLAMIDKLTVRYFFDNATGRLLNDIDDEGAVGREEQPLPEDNDEAVDAPAEEEEQADEEETF